MRGMKIKASIYASQAAESYLRFSTTASACADLVSVRATHESLLRLNLCEPKLCAEEMCSTHVFIIMLQYGGKMIHHVSQEYDLHVCEPDKQDRGFDVVRVKYINMDRIKYRIFTK